MEFRVLLPSIGFRYFESVCYSDFGLRTAFAQPHPAFSALFGKGARMESVQA
jgi:hypothetical protein